MTLVDYDCLDRMSILVLGLGQDFRGDDAAGLEIVRQWVVLHPEVAKRVQIEIVGNPGVELIELINQADETIIVDAIRSSHKTGTVVKLIPSDLDTAAYRSSSAHGLGIVEVLHLLKIIHPDFDMGKVNFIGIVGNQFENSTDMSPEIMENLTLAVDSLNKVVLNALECESKD